MGTGTGSLSDPMGPLRRPVCSRPMRQMIVRVPRGCGERVLSLAREQGAVGTAGWEARADTGGGEDGGGDGGGDGAVDVVAMNLPNAQVEPMLKALEAVPDLHVSLPADGVIALSPPADQAPEQTIDIEPKSPIEVFLSGLQSVGSWKGFLGYAAIAGIVVWIGLFTETIYLLTAAMLIAPFAGPAMNAALATARGDAELFRRSIGRYFAALAVSIAIAFLLSLLMSQRIATGLMVQTSFVSSVAVLLPLAAGAAGALNLCQSERSSLVSGAATGMLVAASLAPPAGLTGMAAAMGEWTMVKSAGFVLLLQIAGINVSGAIIFRFYGVRPDGVRYSRGRPWVGWTAWGGTGAVLAALLAWQFSNAPDLQRSTKQQRAAATARDVVRQSGLGYNVEANARYTRGDIPGADALLVELRVLGRKGRDPEAVKARLAEAVRARLRRDFQADPLVDVVVLEKGG